MSDPMRGAILAHGVGVRGDLPLDRWLVAWAVAVAVAASFAGLALLWHRPQLAKRRDGRPVANLGTFGAVLRSAVAVAGVVLIGLVVATGLFGRTTPGNWAPWAVYIGFWVGLQLASALLGNIWGEHGPFATLARLFDRVRPAPPADAVWTHWPAAAGIGAFAWLELAYYNPSSPRVIGVLAAVHVAVAALGTWRYGRAWARDGEPFAALFGLLGHLAPVGRDDQGRWTLRLPFVGLSGMKLRPGTSALVLVTLGSTTFDGVTRTGWWGDLADGRREWSLTVVNTVGVAVTIGVVAILYLVAVRTMAQLTGGDELELRGDFLPSLVPIALAYSIAHYFSLLVFEGQNVWYRLSDPFDRGWDLLGAATSSVDFRIVSTSTIAWVQAGAIATGHIVGVMVAHDRSIERFSAGTAFRSQLPMLAAMIAYSVAGLFLLLNA